MIFSAENQFWNLHHHHCRHTAATTTNSNNRWHAHNSFERAHRIKLLMCLSCAFCISRCLAYLLWNDILCGRANEQRMKWYNTSRPRVFAQRQFGYSAEIEFASIDINGWLFFFFFCYLCVDCGDSLILYLVSPPFNFRAHMQNANTHTHIQLFEWFSQCAFFYVVRRPLLRINVMWWWWCCLTKDQMDGSEPAELQIRHNFKEFIYGVCV